MVQKKSCPVGLLWGEGESPPFKKVAEAALKCNSTQMYGWDTDADFSLLVVGAESRGEAAAFIVDKERKSLSRTDPDWDEDKYYQEVLGKINEL
jgi:uncharacterized membrane protein